MEVGRGSAQPAPDDDQVPIFGSWRAIYAAVIACALLSMAMIGLFSSWPF